MECTGKLCGLSIDYVTGRQKLEIETNEDIRQEYDRLKDREKVSIKIVEYRKKRSLDANSYMWVLLEKIRQKLHNASTKEEIYMRMLETYGDCVYLPAQTKKEIDDLIAVFRIVRDKGQRILMTESGNLVNVHIMQCYKGSSLYNTKEMSLLIDGVVRECKELGIETETPDEIERMKQEWGINIEKA